MSEFPISLSHALFLLAGTALILAFVSLRFRHRSSRAIAGRDTIVLSRAGPAQELIRYFRKHWTAGQTLLLPTGDGRYPDLIPPAKRIRWFQDLHACLAEGVTIMVIVTRPNPQALEIWKPFVMEGGDRFKLFLLNRADATEEDAVEIERLDTFHPVLLISGPLRAASGVVPKAMWIEHHHPIGSVEAHHIEVIGPRDAAKDERFWKFLDIFRRLVSSAACVEVTRENLPQLIL